MKQAGEPVLEAKKAVERERASRARETEEAIRKLRAQLHAEHQSELDAIALRAQADAERYEGTGEATLVSLADSILDELPIPTIPRVRT